MINVAPINRGLLNVTSTPMIYYMSNNTNPTTTILGQILVVDPDENESFDITFDKTNFRASTAATNPYSLILDDGSLVYVRQIRSYSPEKFHFLGTIVQHHRYGYKTTNWSSKFHIISKCYRHNSRFCQSYNNIRIYRTIFTRIRSKSNNNHHVTLNNYNCKSRRKAN